MTIIEQTYNLLRSRYITDFDQLVIADIRVGCFLTAVRLSDGSIGTASTLDDEHPFCSKDQRDFGEFTPLKIKGRKVSELLETPDKSYLIRSLKTATLNALSSSLITSERYKIVEDKDPVDLIDMGKGRIITIVGAFQSYISRISGSGNKLNVLELNENALKPEQRKYYVPAASFGEVIPGSDVVIITGQTLVNRTIDELLSAVRPGTQVAVTGPSGSMVPDILFENNVTIIGAARITDPELAFDIAGEGGLGYHLFRYCAQKICVLKKDES